MRKDGLIVTLWTLIYWLTNYYLFHAKRKIIILK